MTFSALRKTTPFKNNPGVVLLLAGMTAIWLIDTISSAWLGQAPIVSSWLRADMQALLHGEVWRLAGAGLLIGQHYFGLIITWLIVYAFGRELESQWGQKKFIIFCLGTSTFAFFAQALLKFIIPALPDDFAPAEAFGTSPMVQSLIVAFALRNRDKTVNFLFFSAKGMILFWISLGLLVLEVISRQSPPSGLFAIAFAMLASWAFGSSDPSPWRRFFLRRRLSRLEEQNRHARDQRLKKSGLRIVEKSDSTPPGGPRTYH